MHALHAMVIKPPHITNHVYAHVLYQLSGAEEHWHNRVSHILSEPTGQGKHLAGRTGRCHEVIPNPHPPPL